MYCYIKHRYYLLHAQLNVLIHVKNILFLLTIDPNLIPFSLIPGYLLLHSQQTTTQKKHIFRRQYL